MHSEILVSVDDNETRVVLLEGKVPQELYVERRGEERIAGSIYKGKVKGILPGMEASFVDIGLGKDGFLYISDIGKDIDIFEEVVDSPDEDVDAQLKGRGKRRNIEDVLKEGEEILVQVVKEPIGAKGARLTSRISLPGRFLVLMPAERSLGVSRRVEGLSERRRLRALLDELKLSDMGAIVRTAGEGKKKRDFLRDAKFLVGQWQRIKKLAQRASAPALVYQESGLIYRVVRDLLTLNIDKIVIDSKQEYRNLRKYLRSLAVELGDVVELYGGKTPLFESYNVDKAIERALRRKVWLKSGGHILIDPTEALVTIDVNSGKYAGKKNLEDTVLKINLEAAVEIARQLRLRNLGGIIIIDFIDMELKKNKGKVIGKLRDEVKRDRAKTKVIQLTDLGLVEMTRQRVRDSLAKLLLESCPYCKGTGAVKSVKTMSIEVQRRLEKTCAETDKKSLRVEVHPKVASYLIGEEKRRLSLLERKFRKRITISENPNFHIEDIKF